MSKALVRVGAAALLAALIAGALLYRDRFDAGLIEAWLASAGFAAPLLFMLIYALATVLFLPGSVLTLAGGALFGPFWGTLYNLTGATLGAACAFLIARHSAAGWVRERAGNRLSRLIEGVEEEGWRFVAFTRLVPLFPFNLLNYALGLTRIPLVPYLAATFVFMLPGAVAFTWLGYAGREAAAGSEGLIRKMIIALALLACVAFLPRLVSRLRRRPTLTVDDLRRGLDDGTATVLDVRSPEEFHGELGHIPGALNIPLDQLESRIAALDGVDGAAIAIVCRTDRRSARAQAILERHGRPGARVVKGGMTAWVGAGQPLVREVDEGGCAP